MVLWLATALASPIAALAMAASAIRILVEGYFEPVIAQFDDEHLETLVRERIAAKLVAAHDDIVAYAATR